MEQAQRTGSLSSITVESVRNNFKDRRNNKTMHIKGSIRRKQLKLWAKPQYLIDIVQI